MGGLTMVVICAPHDASAQAGLAAKNRCLVGGKRLSTLELEEILD
jgi:hypothetical protein